MGVYYEVIPKSQHDWILSQQVFWVATAPLSNSGHVNISPKGGKYFGLSDEKTFWYMDFSGSGNETISHLHEPSNGRITILFNAFSGPPKIIRLWGKGRVLERNTPQFEEFTSQHNVEILPGLRSMIIVDIHQVGTSCGFTVPVFDFKEHRTQLHDIFEKKEEKFKAGNEKESLERYWAYKNAWSMDNLPGMKQGLAVADIEKIAPIKKMVGPLAPKGYTNTTSASEMGIRMVLIAIVSFLVGVLFATYRPGIVGSVRMAMVS